MAAISRSGLRAVVVALDAVSNVELIADDWKPHGMSAVQETTVLDCVETDVGGDVSRPSAVPTGPMPRFRRLRTGLCHLACCGTYPGGSAAPSPKKKSSMCLAIRSCASRCHGMSRYSLRIIFMRSSHIFQA